MLWPVFGHMFTCLCVCEPHNQTDRRTNKMMIIFLNKPKFVIGLSTSKVNIYRWLQNYHVSQMVIVCNIFQTFCPFRSECELFSFCVSFWPFICVLSFLLSFVVYEREMKIWSLHVPCACLCSVFFFLFITIILPIYMVCKRCGTLHACNFCWFYSIFHKNKQQERRKSRQYRRFHGNIFKWWKMRSNKCNLREQW